MSNGHDQDGLGGERDHPKTPPGSVVITTAQMYQLLLETRDLVRDVSTTLNTLNREFERHRNSDETQFTDIEQKIDKNTRWRHAVPPTMILAVGAVISNAIEWFKGN